MMPCFKLKDKRHLQQRNECLAEIAACCKLELTSGTGGNPGAWLVRSPVLSLPICLWHCPSCLTGAWGVCVFIAYCLFWS